MRIGVLALQGAFAEHLSLLQTLGVDSFEIRHPRDLEGNQADGYILPGGESTVMAKLLHDLTLFSPLQKCIVQGVPVFGTCAGLILLANRIVNDVSRGFGAMDIVAVRNAYGRQLGSFETIRPFAHCGPIPMVFIRAPYIESVGDSVEVLATVDSHIVAARQKNILVTAFHPELTASPCVHQYFLNMIKEIRSVPIYDYKIFL